MRFTWMFMLLVCLGCTSSPGDVDAGRDAGRLDAGDDAGKADAGSEEDAAIADAGGDAGRAIDAGRDAGSTDAGMIAGGECDETSELCGVKCFRPVYCVHACGGPETPCGCCPCAEGSIDSITCGVDM